MGKQSRRAWRKQHDKIIRGRQEAEREAQERTPKVRAATLGETLALAQRGRRA